MQSIQFHHVNELTTNRCSLKLFTTIDFDVNLIYGYRYYICDIFANYQSIRMPSRKQILFISITESIARM